MRFLDPLDAADVTPLEDLERSPGYMPASLMACWHKGPSTEGIAGAFARLGGIVVQPAETVLGLRGWEDAFEGILPSSQAPYVFFDLEKIIRMMLRQSHLAFEILAAPCLTRAPGFQPRELIGWLVTSKLFTSYHDLPPARDITTLRPLLTGALLAATGELSLSLPTLLDALGEHIERGTLSALTHSAPQPEAVARADKSARALLREGIERALMVKPGPSVNKAKSLPEHPIGYDDANAALVRWRLASAVGDNTLA